MQDPSGGVPPPLLNHVHLVSQFQYQYAPNQLTPEVAVQYLLRAPQIVREAPVSWQYLQHPQDGTIFLAWQPTNQMGQQFATDGFVWASPETAFTHEFRGYTIEFYASESGLLPQIDQLTVHRRVRYKLASSPNNQPVDPSLELVHYTISYPEHRIPSRQVQVSPQVQRQMSERRFLEQSGPLERKPFMLHDRNNWPQIAMPGSQISGNLHQPGAAFGRGGPVGPFQKGSQPVGQAPAGVRAGVTPIKRGQASLSRIPAAASMSNSFVEELLKDEENHGFGDTLDFVTPRDLSILRYAQHHEWMEEILSSPYEINRILPVGLGLRLGGELKELTDGLWNQPKDVEGSKATSRDQVELTKEHVEELEKRVAEFVRKSEAETSNMKQMHQAKMKEMSQQKLFANLERRLAEAAGDAQVDEIIRAAEVAVGAPISQQEQVVNVARGGHLGVEELNPTTNQDEFDVFTNMDTAGEALDFYDTMDYTS